MFRPMPPGVGCEMDLGWDAVLERCTCTRLHSTGEAVRVSQVLCYHALYSILAWLQVVPLSHGVFAGERLVHSRFRRREAPLPP